MSIAGYNVDPEGSSPVVGVELADNSDQAILYVDEGQGCTEIPLSYNETCALLAQLQEVHAEMQWNRASYLFASTVRDKKTHLLRKGTIKRPLHDLAHEINEHALCGQSPPSYGWSLTPVLVAPHSDCCKKCLSVYAKEQRRIA
jgi:hypothetical protein